MSWVVECYQEYAARSLNSTSLLIQVENPKVYSLTIWLCWDWVAPYIAMPLVGGASCGVSDGVKPRLSMRLDRRQKEKSEGVSEKTK